ncbi:MAG: hypothetical protein U0103_00380 [Candidatus Obscuribacterales bacterium]
MQPQSRLTFVFIVAVLVSLFATFSASAQDDSQGGGGSSPNTGTDASANSSTDPSANANFSTDSSANPSTNNGSNTSADNSAGANADAPTATTAGSASSALTVPTLNPDIASLETRFFDHTYPNEPMATRLDRLERMVFGEQKTGSDQSRLTALLLAVPAEPAASTTQTSQNGTGIPQASTPDSQAAQQNPSGSDQNSTDNTASGIDSGDVGDYPRITQLEQEILGKTFTNEPIQNRLEQLELKAFGKANTRADLSDRTEKLEDYADKHFPQQQQNYADTAYSGYPGGGYQSNNYPAVAPQYPQQPGYGYPQATQNANLLPPHSTLDQKVTWLEQQVFGATYPTQPLLDRVNKLASNIFPADSPQRSQSLADQVNSMIGSIELNPRRGAPQMAPAIAPTMAQAPNYGQSTQYSPPPFSQYPQEQYGAAPNYSSQYNQSSGGLSGTQATQAPSQNHKHSFIHGLEHVLGTVGSMAAGSMMMSGMGGGGYGYGMPFGL